MNKKRLVFLGNFEEGILSLSRLLKEGYHVALCLGDKRSDALRQYCASNNLNYEDGSIVKGQGFLELLDFYKTDLLVSNNFLYLLPINILSKYTAINLHSSLLPDFKGRAPVVQTIIAGEHKAGYTVHYMSPEMDSGNVLIQRKILLSGDETSLDIMKMLLFNQPSDIVEAVQLALSNFEGTPINAEGRSLDIENFREIILGADTLKECSRKLRAFIKPYPLPYIMLSGMRFFVHRATCSTTKSNEDGIVSLKLRDGYLNLSEVSIHGEIGFSAKNIFEAMGIYV